MNNKGVSAILGIILMIAIVVAITITVYIYVNDYLINKTDSPNIELEGELRGYWGNEIMLDNNTIEVKNLKESYLSNFIGKNITLIVYDVEGIYYYRGAYLN